MMESKNGKDEFHFLKNWLGRKIIIRDEENREEYGIEPDEHTFIGIHHPAQKSKILGDIELKTPSCPILVQEETPRNETFTLGEDILLFPEFNEHVSYIVEDTILQEARKAGRTTKDLYTCGGELVYDRFGHIIICSRLIQH